MSKRGKIQSHKHQQLRKPLDGVKTSRRAEKIEDISTWTEKIKELWKNRAVFAESN